MHKTFKKLSRRAHVTKEAINLIRRKEIERTEFFLGGGVSEKNLRKDARALAVMAMNPLNILLRHFREKPPDWINKFDKARNNLMKGPGTTAKRA